MTTSTESLVFLPGLICDHALWREQMIAFSTQFDCRVADLTGSETVGEMAQSVLSDSPPRFNLAALSMGGYVAFEILRQAPERVAKLALLNTKARPDSKDETTRRKELLSAVGVGNFKGATGRLLPLFIHEDRLSDEDLTAEIEQMAERVGKDAFVRQQKAILSRPDSRPGLSRISCPTLVIGSRQDRLTPVDCHEEIAEGIPGSELIIIEDCGHLSPMEHPDRVTEELQGLFSESA
ncbi:alpha/beta fold hydrolase [Pelagibius sp. Alg239-R121]|uniref:alpha/beta fold hydrolase n=1 Tax=Pelagibius sp. Alg239-R121 TaxID=2993448 RepID=UPI0024A610E1|nr:alpha/beta hydrolase [Pelagibius sp. Alg239-R121]